MREQVFDKDIINLCLLLPRLRASAPARVVNVASKVHADAKSIDWEAVRRPTRAITALPEYAVSKLGNVLFTKELARGRAGAQLTLDIWYAAWLKSGTLPPPY